MRVLKRGFRLSYPRKLAEPGTTGRTSASGSAEPPVPLPSGGLFGLSRHPPCICLAGWPSADGCSIDRTDADLSSQRQYPRQAEYLRRPARSRPGAPLDKRHRKLGVGDDPERNQDPAGAVQPRAARAGNGIDCRYCHTSVENSAFAGIPPTKTCMNCHSEIFDQRAVPRAGAGELPDRTRRSSGRGSTTCPTSSTSTTASTCTRASAAPPATAGWTRCR